MILARDPVAHFVSGAAFDLALPVPDDDGDPVRHAPSTTEDRVVEGRYRIRVYLRDQLPFDGDPLEGLLWEGVLVVGPYEPDDTTVTLSVEAAT